MEKKMWSSLGVVLLVVAIAGLLLFTQKNQQTIAGEAGKSYPFQQICKENGSRVLDCIIVFEDKQLEKDIKQQFKLPPNVLTLSKVKSSLKKKPFLELSPKPSYQSLNGLQFFKDLTMLKINSPLYKQPDLTPLKGLTNLEILELSGDGITDIEPLSGLKKLTTLDLTNPGPNGFPNADDLKDIGPLSALTNLKYLRLGYNKIEDVTPLLPLSNLKYLEIMGNPLPKSCPNAKLPIEGEENIKDFLKICLGK